MLKILNNLFQFFTTALISRPSCSQMTPVISEAPDVQPQSTSPLPVFIDIETTGLNREGSDEILEIAIVDVEGNALLDTLVRPVRNSNWPDAQAIHGISPQDVINAPTWDILLPRIALICEDKGVVFYNASFDTSFFPEGFFPSVACAMHYYSQLHSSGRTWVKLSVAAQASGYVQTGAYHRALEDALACRHIWLFSLSSIEKTFAPITNQRVIAELVLKNSEHIKLVFKEIFTEDMRLVTTKTRCNFWTKDDYPMINLYRSGTKGANTKIATLSKTENIELAKLVTSASYVTTRLKDSCDDTLLFTVEPSVIAKLVLENGKRIKVVFKEIFIEEMLRVTTNTCCNF